VDDALQSGPYRAHMGDLAAALLAASAPPCALPHDAAQSSSSRGWPAGFAPLPAPQLSARWDAPARRQLRALLRRLPPALQAGVSLAARGGPTCADGGDDVAVTAELRLVAGAAPFAGALAAQRDSGGRSAMHCAAEAGLERCVALLARWAPQLVSAADAAGATPLGLAARQGAARAGRALLDAGADADDDDTVRPPYLSQRGLGGPSDPRPGLHPNPGPSMRR